MRIRVCFVSVTLEEQEGGVLSQLLQCLHMVYDTAVSVSQSLFEHGSLFTHHRLKMWQRSAEGQMGTLEFGLKSL